MSKESKRVEYFAGLLEKALIKNRKLKAKLDEVQEYAMQGKATSQGLLKLLNK